MFSAGMSPAYSSGQLVEDLVRDQLRLGEGHQVAGAPRPDVATAGMGGCADRVGPGELLAHGPVRSSRRASGHDGQGDRKSTRLNSSHVAISYAVFCLKKKKNTETTPKPGTIHEADKTTSIGNEPP